MKKLTNLFFYSSFFISACALALVAETYLQSGLPVNWQLSFLIFFATLFLYNLDSLLPYKTAQVQLVSERKKWLLEHRDLLKGIVLVSGAAASGLFIYLLPQIPPAFIIPIFLISVLYSLPVLPGRRGKFPLRDVPFLKVFLIAGVWAALTVWLPLEVAGQRIGNPEMLLILRRFVFIFALTLLFDIRDTQKDKLSGTLTFPVKFGTDFTRFLSLGAMALFAVLVHFQQTGAVRIALEISAVVAGLVIYFTNPKRSDYYFAILADGMMLLQFLVVWSLLG